MFIVVLKYVKPIEVIDALLDEHVRFLGENFAAGYFIASGRRVPRTGGVILAQAQSREEIEAVVFKDPFYTNGAAEYDIIEFNPTKAGRGFEVLLRTAS